MVGELPRLRHSAARVCKGICDDLMRVLINNISGAAFPQHLDCDAMTLQQRPIITHAGNMIVGRISKPADRLRLPVWFGRKSEPRWNGKICPEPCLHIVESLHVVAIQPTRCTQFVTGLEESLLPSRIGIATEYDESNEHCAL